MSEVEFLPLWYTRKRRRRARMIRFSVVAAVPLVGLAAWLWLA
jgi:hypothetical protein